MRIYGRRFGNWPGQKRRAFLRRRRAQQTQVCLNTIQSARSMST